MKSVGIPDPDCPAHTWKIREKPNSKPAAEAYHGFQRPRMTQARAMKPCPALISRTKLPTLPILNAAPPSPAKSPANVVAQKRLLLTSIPTLSAAKGCSPTDLSLRPYLVR